MQKTKNKAILQKKTNLRNKFLIIKQLLSQIPNYNILTQDKESCYFLMKKTIYNHLLPKMYFAGKVNDIELSNISSPCIIKPTTMSCGRGV